MDLHPHICCIVGILRFGLQRAASPALAPLSLLQTVVALAKQKGHQSPQAAPVQNRDHDVFCGEVLEGSTFCLTC